MLVFWGPLTFVEAKLSDFIQCFLCGIYRKRPDQFPAETFMSPIVSETVTITLITQEVTEL